MRPIVFYVHAWHHLQNIEPIIQKLESHNINYKIFVFVPKDDNFSRVEKLFPKEALEIMSERLTFRIGEHLNTRGKIRAIFYVLWSFLWLTIFFTRHKPSRLVVTEDTTYWSNLAIKVARMLGIKRIHLPTENIIFVHMSLENRLREGRIVPEHSSILQRLAHTLYPVNVQAYQGKLLYWYGAYRLIGSYFLGLLPRTPWVRGSNHMDCVAVNSRVQFEENVRYGLKADDQIITGFPMHDQLIDRLHQRETIKNTMFDQLGIPAQKRICLVIGTAPRFLWHEEELPQVYTAHGELVRALYGALGDDWQILVKVHPREDRASFVEKIGAKDAGYVSFLKTEFSVYDLMAVSDVVLMFKSSTVIAALALDTPVLAYGIHDLPDMADFYNHYPSIDQVYSLDELRAVLGKIDNLAYRSDLECRRKQDGDQYGMFDGNNTRRVVEVILS